MPLTVIIGLLIVAIAFPIVGGAELLVVSAVIVLGAVVFVVIQRGVDRRVGDRERETDQLANRPS
ncbi:MAG TPA: hypothetical protein VD931_08600 [Baekduia sp.]|nr:hypothetical protein [Baekduia sp.]